MEEKPQQIEDWMEMIANQEVKPDIIQDLLPDGIATMLIAGRPGVGKTNFVLQLGLSIANGVPFLGFRCQQKKILYLTFEGIPQKLSDRLKKQMPNFDRANDGMFSIFMSPPRKLGLFNEEYREIAQSVDIIIIDPLRWMVDGDYCKPMDMAEFTRKLRMFEDETKTSMILVHHPKKPGGFTGRSDPSDMNELKGATELMDAAQSIVVLAERKGSERKRGEKDFVNKKTLYMPKTRDALQDLPPINLFFDRDKCMFVSEELGFDYLDSEGEYPF